MSILEKYNLRAKKASSLLCVGLDSDLEKTPDSFRDQKFPQFEFNKWVITETNQFVSAYKPNLAFYQARGDGGIKELKMTMEYLGENFPDIFTICDAKLADISSTNEQYAKFVFDWLGFDALTVNPYLGKEALTPFLSRKDKAVIVLCRTSNTGAGDLQDLEVEGVSLWLSVAKKVFEGWNENKNCMLVVGATYPKEMRRIRQEVGGMTVLSPGIGSQGGDIRQILDAGLNSEGLGLILNASRSVIFSEKPGLTASQFQEKINEARFSKE